MLHPSLSSTTGPLSAYNIFFKNERPKVLSEMLGAVSFEQLGKLIGERWRALNPEQRKTYEHHARKDVLRYRKQMDNFEDLRRQRFRHAHHPVGSSYNDKDMDTCNDDSNNNNKNTALPCVSFEDAPSPPPIIHDAPPPMYQLPAPIPSVAADTRNSCRTPSGSPEPTSTTSLTTGSSRPYPTTSLSTAMMTGGRTPGAPPVTPPTPRPVVLPQTTARQGTNGNTAAANSNNSSSNIRVASMNADYGSLAAATAAAAAYQRQGYSSYHSSSNSSYYPDYLNSSSNGTTWYQTPPPHSSYSSPHTYRHLVHPDERQIVLPMPPGRCLGGPPEHIAIPQGMEVYLPITRTVSVPSPSRASAMSSSSTSSSSDGGLQHNNSSNSHHSRHQEHHHEQRQQQVIVTGKRKYKVYYSAYRMKRSEADDYLNCLSDTLASWNTTVSATMASPLDSFVLNDETTTSHHDNEMTVEMTTSAAAAVAAAAPAPPCLSSPPIAVASHGGGPNPSFLHPYYSSSYGYGEMQS
jgi:HMG (high mobility group) box